MLKSLSQPLKLLKTSCICGKKNRAERFAEKIQLRLFFSCTAIEIYVQVFLVPDLPSSCVLFVSIAILKGMVSFIILSQIRKHVQQGEK